MSLQSRKRLTHFPARTNFVPVERRSRVAYLLNVIKPVLTLLVLFTMISGTAPALAKSPFGHFHRGAGKAINTQDKIATIATTVAGDLLWEDTVDLSGDYDAAFDVAVEGTRAFVVGAATPSGSSCPGEAPGNCDFYVRAYDLSTGTLLWEDSVDRVGGTDVAYYVAVNNGTVVVSGVVDSDGTCSSFTASGNCDFYVRAYDGATGTVLWEDQVDIAGGFDFARATIGGGWVYAIGWVTTADGDDDILVRAYNAATGALQWQDQYDQGGREVPWDVVVRGNRLYVSGSVSGDATCVPYPFAGNCDAFVRAYHAPSGTVLWSAQRDLAGGFDEFRAIAVAAGRVYVTGTAAADASCDPYNGTGNCNFYVQAYDAFTGAALWDDQFDVAGSDDEAISIGTANGRVYASGWGSDASGNPDFLVRAYDGATGTALWTDLTDTGAGGYDAAFDLKVRGERVFAVGGGPDFQVRAYDGATGTLVWEDQVVDAGGFGFAGAVAVGAGKVIAVGYGYTEAAGNFDFLVRTYDAH